MSLDSQARVCYYLAEHKGNGVRHIITVVSCDIENYPTILGHVSFEENPNNKSVVDTLEQCIYSAWGDFLKTQPDSDSQFIDYLVKLGFKAEPNTTSCVVVHSR